MLSNSNSNRLSTSSSSSIISIYNKNEKNNNNSPKNYYFPKRFNLIILGFLALLICYTTRTLLSTTIIFMKRDNHYSATFKGILLASFSMGYTTTQLVAQFLCDRFGGKNVLLFGLSTSIGTLFLVPIAAPNRVAIVFVRILCGVFQGIAMPSMNWLIAKYFPLSQRSTCASIIWSGVYAGNIVISFTSPVMLEYISWKDCFYIVGSICLGIWAIPWFIFIKDNPKDLIGIHESEIDFINQKSTKPLDIKLKMLTQSQAININTILQASSGINNDDENNNQKSSISTSVDNENLNNDKQSNTLVQSNNGSLASSSSNSIESLASYESGIQNELNSSSTSQKSKPAKKNFHNDEKRLPYWVALKTLLLSRGMLTLVYVNITCNWAYFLLLGWLPSWLSKELGIDTGYKFATLNALPFLLCFLIAIIFGVISDKLLSIGVRKIVLRKIFGGCCYGLPGIFLLFVSLVVPDEYKAVRIAFVIIAIAANGFSTISYQLVTLDLSVNYSGVSMGIANICSAIPAVIGPLIAGFLLETFHGDWNKIFLISSTFYLFGTIVWITFLKVDIVI